MRLYYNPMGLSIIVLMWMVCLNLKLLFTNVDNVQD